MSRSGDSASASGPGPDDSRVVAALEEYAAALKAGQAPGRAEFLARHPEIAPALAECLEGLDWVRATAPGPAPAGLARVPAGAGLEPDTPLGDFHVLREIGRGGMGVVYEAVQVSLGRHVALKVLPVASALGPELLQRFKAEAHAAARLHHTNIVPVFAVGCERGTHYYAMQLIEGQTLAALIRELRRQAGERPPQAPEFFRAVARLGIQAAEALEHAHQLGVVHRDVKPGNLLVEGELGASPSRARLWVTDFGLAHCRAQAGLTVTADLAGTLRYMSPEQALARPEAVDHRTDIYSLGATLYELLTLGPAFGVSDRQELLRQIAFEGAAPPRRVNRAIPAELETIVLKAMAKGPAERYATAQELADDLDRFLKNEPIRASLLIQQAINAILRTSLGPTSLDEQLHRILGLILELPWLALERKGAIYLADEGAKVLVRKAQVGMPPGRCPCVPGCPSAPAFAGRPSPQRRSCSPAASMPATPSAIPGSSRTATTASRSVPGSARSAC